MKPNPSRLPLLDLLKAGASQLIVLHHLAFYGPMSDVAYTLVPAGIDWLYDYARIAVQVFLVIAGFLACRSLAPAGEVRAFPLRETIAVRYCRLALPLIVAVLLSILAAGIARGLMEHESIPDAPTLGQFLSHVFLLQNLLDQDSLSAGVWYVAIDFQLFSVLALILWACTRLPRWRWAAMTMVGAAGIASLFQFNRQAELDAWWIYFFGAYAMGVFAQWASVQRRGGACLWLLLIVGIAALSVEFRSRIAVALATALLIGWGGRLGWLQGCPSFAPTRWLSRISYSVFLIHFPVCLLTNAVVFHLFPESATLNLAGMLAAWLLSIVAGWQFHLRVESRLALISPVRLLPSLFTRFHPQPD